jgi:methylthioribulose-1-phosphate dehydratase
MQDERITQLSEQLQQMGADFHRRGWVLATSGNFSAVCDREPYRLLITASGRHKGQLGPGDFLTLDSDGKPTTPGPDRPSAETALHLMITQSWSAGAVLHTHSTWATILSGRYGGKGGIMLEGFEMLKAFTGVTTHDHKLWVPIFPNTQDIPTLAREVEQTARSPRPPRFGFLIQQHGLYTWGRDLAEAYRHLEAFEFLFEVMGRLTIN